MSNQKEHKFRVIDKESRITQEMITECTSREQALEYSATLMANLLDADMKIKQAQASYFETGNYANPVWYAKLTSYRKVLGFLHQLCAQKLRELKYDKQESEKIRQMEFRDMFFKVAKDELTGKQFDKLLKLTEKRIVDTNLQL